MLRRAERFVRPRWRMPSSTAKRAVGFVIFILSATLLAPLPRTEQEVFLNACDIGLVPLVENMLGVAMPSRTYNLLAAGKPILALTDENSEVSRVIHEENVGWNVPPLAPEKLLAAIETIYESREQLPAMGMRARRAAEEKYSVDVAVAKYRQLILNDHL